MKITVQEIVKDIIGKPCSLKRVGERKSLSIGFGKIVPHKRCIKDVNYPEWDIRTYYDSCRILKGGRILCGRQDTVDSEDELDDAVNRIEIGCFAALLQITDLDVRVECDNGVAIDFLGTRSDGDESVNIFCPEDRIIKFVVGIGWITGPSDKPWEWKGKKGNILFS